MIQRLGVWSGFLAIWAGIVTHERAKRMADEHYYNAKAFNAPYGVHTPEKIVGWLLNNFDVSNHSCTGIKILKFGSSSLKGSISLWANVLAFGSPRKGCASAKGTNIYFLKIFSIVFPFANSSTNLSK